MIPFSPNWLTDQGFLETVTVLQNPIPQRGSFVGAQSKPTQWRLCLALRRWAQGLTAGRGERRNALMAQNPRHRRHREVALRSSQCDEAAPGRCD